MAGPHQTSYNKIPFDEHELAARAKRVLSVDAEGNPIAPGSGDASEATLIQIRDYLDTVETKLQVISDNTDGLEGYTDGIESLLTTLNGYVDGLEAALTTLNAKDFATASNQSTVIGHIDGIESALTAIQGYIDGLETVLGTSSDVASATGSLHAKLRQLVDNTDGLEGFSDQLEGFVDGIETLLTTLNGYVDGLEGLVDGIEGQLTTITGHVDGLEASLGTSADAASATGSIHSKLRQIADNTDGIESTLTTISGNVDGIEAALNTIIGHVDGIESALATLNAKDFATQTTLATRLSESDFDTKTGALTETAPASDTASSGLNGRLQRLAQRLTSLITELQLKADLTETQPVSAKGTVAHDSADADPPVKTGAKAKGSLTGITPVATDDVTDLFADLDGVRLWKRVPFADIINNGGQTLTTTASTAVTNLGALANTRNYITAISIWNASNANTYVKFQDGNGGAQFWTMPAPATSGSVLHFDPPLRQPTANTALYIAENATANAIIVSINGFQSKL